MCQVCQINSEPSAWIELAHGSFVKRLSHSNPTVFHTHSARMCGRAGVRGPRKWCVLPSVYPFVDPLLISCSYPLVSQQEDGEEAEDQRQHVDMAFGQARNSQCNPGSGENRENRESRESTSFSQCWALALSECPT